MNIISNPGLSVLVQPHELHFEITDGVMDGPLGVLLVDILFVNQAPEFVYEEYFVTIPEKCDDTTPGSVSI